MTERTERQQRVLNALRDNTDPLTGTELAQRCGVTRQVVVHDIAILRAANVPIFATPRGYLLQKGEPLGHEAVLSVSHGPELTKIELQIMVDHGLQVLDVVVEHPIYGELRGALHLSSRRDVELFLKRVQASSAVLLSSLTEGDHLHTVRYHDDAQLREATDALRSAGIEVHL